MLLVVNVHTFSRIFVQWHFECTWCGCLRFASPNTRQDKTKQCFFYLETQSSQRCFVYSWLWPYSFGLLSDPLQPMMIKPIQQSKHPWHLLSGINIKTYWARWLHSHSSLCVPKAVHSWIFRCAVNWFLKANLSTSHNASPTLGSRRVFDFHLIFPFEDEIFINHRTTTHITSFERNNPDDVIINKKLSLCQLALY